VKQSSYAHSVNDREALDKIRSMIVKLINLTQHLFAAQLSYNHWKAV